MIGHQKLNAPANRQSRPLAVGRRSVSLINLLRANAAPKAVKVFARLVAFAVFSTGGASGVASAVAAGSLVMVPANHPGIAYEGRTFMETTGAVQLGFPGVTAHLHFRSNVLVMRANASDDDLYVDVGLDGGTPTLLRLHKGEGEYTIIKADISAEHVVTITRRNESWQGTIGYLGFSLGTGGEWLATPDLPLRKLMFIGDSVTCGEMTAYELGRDMRDKMNSNARLSYGAILARRLGAQCHLVSYGGRGIIRDWQGIRDTRNAPQFYELALPDDPAVRWLPSRYVPDAIGIQLGTNDFSQGIPDQNEFINSYVEFIEKIQRDAPGAWIFVMDSPILVNAPGTGPRREVLHAYLEQVVRRVGSTKVFLASLSHYPGVPGNGHPTGSEHELMANELEPVVRQALGW